MHDCWLTPCFYPDKLKLTAERIVGILQKHPDIKAIAITGKSGALMGGAVSMLSGLPLILIRKKNELHDSHSNHMVSYQKELPPDTSVCLLDDLISTGDTIDRMIDELEIEEFVASLIILYYKGETNVYNRPEGVRIPIEHAFDR